MCARVLEGISLYTIGGCFVILFLLALVVFLLLLVVRCVLRVCCLNIIRIVVLVFLEVPNNNNKMKNSIGVEVEFRYMSSEIFRIMISQYLKLINKCKDVHSS